MSDNLNRTNRLEDDDLDAVAGGFSNYNSNNNVDYYVVKGFYEGRYIYEGSLTYEQALALCEQCGFDKDSCIFKVPQRINTVFG